MSRIPTHTVEDAPEASRPLLQNIAQSSPSGRPLKAHAQMAHSPAVLAAYTSLRAVIAEHGTFVHTPAATLWAHFRGGDGGAGLADLKGAADTMIDDLLWWGTALKESARVHSLSGWGLEAQGIQNGIDKIRGPKQWLRRPARCWSSSFAKADGK